MKRKINSFQLKCVCVAMMIFGMAVQMVSSVYSLMHPGTDTKWLVPMLSFGQIIYLAAFPISAFLLVEAFLHTGNRKKLLFRLMMAAMLAELPMDVANHTNQIAKWGQEQNYFFTLVLGLLVLQMVETISKKAGQGTLKANLLTLLVYLVATTAAIFLRTEQSSVGVLTVIALYLFYGNKRLSLMVVAMIYLLFAGGVGANAGVECLPAAGILLLWLYNGERGKANKVTRAVFYFAFPVAYCLIRCIMHFVA